MSKRIAFRGMEPTPAIEKYIDQQLEKVEKFLSHERSPVYINLVLDAAPDHAHNRVELLVKSPNYDLVSHYEGPKMYDAIDEAIDRMYLELKKAKDKRIDSKKEADSYKKA